MLYQAILVGLGKMGFAYGEPASNQKTGLSHFGALRNHPRFEIEFCIDSNPEVCKVVNERYGMPVATSIDLAPQNLSPSLLVVATPTETHLETILQGIGKWNPKAILLEKPAALNLNDLLEIYQATSKRGIPVFINYPRRYSEGALQIAEKISLKNFIAPAKGIIWFGEDLLNSGIHFFDLMELWFGKVDFLEKCGCISGKGDFIFGNEKVQIQMMQGISSEYTHTSGEIFFMNGRLTIGHRDEGFHWFPIVNDSFYSGYKVLLNSGTKFEMKLEELQFNVLAAICNYLDGFDKTPYLLEHSLTNYKLIFDALSEVRDIP